MGLTRNLLLFAIIALSTSACGGGSSAITNAGSTGVDSSSVGGLSNVPVTYGSVTLHWTAPTTRADNTAASLSEISSYRLYYGPSATDTPNFINIPGSSTTQYNVTLPSGTYYFRISAIDTNGYEGLRSSALQKTL